MNIERPATGAGKDRKELIKRVAIPKQPFARASSTLVPCVEDYTSCVEYSIVYLPDVLFRGSRGY